MTGEIKGLVQTLANVIYNLKIVAGGSSVPTVPLHSNPHGDASQVLAIAASLSSLSPPISHIAKNANIGSLSITRHAPSPDCESCTHMRSQTSAAPKPVPLVSLIHA